MKSFLLVLCLFSNMVFAATSKPQVATQKAKLTKVAKTLLYPALVKSRIESNIRAENDYIVIRQIVQLGQKVKKGDQIVELRSQDTSVNYQNRILRAPVDGIIASLFVNQGEYIQKGQHIALINNPEDLYLKMEIPVANYSEVKLGLVANAKSPLNNDQKIKATIMGIGTVMDSSTGTIPVELSLEKDVKLLPGSILQVEVVLNEEEKFLVSEKALYYSGDKVFLPILINGKVQKREVTLGSRQNGMVEISKGVNEGEELITGAGEFLKDNQEVSVIKSI